MDRFSGIAMFLGAYTICIVAILCCLHIKDDAQGIRQDQLISPAINFLDRQDRKPVHYVVMNPIKKDLPIELEKRSRGPNMLIAMLPAEATLASSSAADSIGLAEASLMQPLLDTVQVVSPVPEADSTSPFTLSAFHKEVVETPDMDPAESSIYPTSAESFGAVTTPAHILIANDLEGVSWIRNSIEQLKNLGMHSAKVISIKTELNSLLDSGELDPGICEGIIYRIQSEINELGSESDDEDARLLQFVKDQVQMQIGIWLDQLNGIEVVDQPVYLKEEADFELMNTALLTFLNCRVR